MRESGFIGRSLFKGVACGLSFLKRRKLKSEWTFRVESSRVEHLEGAFGSARLVFFIEQSRTYLLFDSCSMKRANMKLLFDSARQRAESNMRYVRFVLDRLDIESYKNALKVLLNNILYCT